MFDQTNCQRCEQPLSVTEYEVFPCEVCDQKIDEYAKRTNTDAPAMKRMLRCGEAKLMKLVIDKVGL